MHKQLDINMQPLVYNKVVTSNITSVVDLIPTIRKGFDTSTSASLVGELVEHSTSAKSLQLYGLNLHIFISVLQKNKFPRNFSVPPIITATTNKNIVQQ